MILKQLNRSKRYNKVIRANATMWKNFKYFNQVMLQPKLLEVSLTLEINKKNFATKTENKLQRWNVSMTLLDSCAAASGFLHWQLKP